MSAAAGNLKRVPIRVLTIALFAAGGIIAAIAVYQQFVISSEPVPYAVTKEEAIEIALKEVDNEPDRDALVLPDKEAKAVLIHLGKDGWAFLVDESSMGDFAAFMRDDRLQGHENTYAWYVTVTTSNINGGSRGYWYLIDIDSGQTIGKS